MDPSSSLENHKQTKPNQIKQLLYILIEENIMSYENLTVFLKY